MKNFFFSLLSLFRIRNAKRDGYAPYADPKCNRAYNQLFCDKVRAYLRDAKGELPPTWRTLLSDEPSAQDLRKIADDPSEQSRARLLASYRLRELLQPVTEKLLLAVIVEVRLPDGLDVLAGFQDGGVVYIHHRERVLDFEPSPLEWRPTLLRLFNAAQNAVDSIGPWLDTRVAPPTEGMIRMSFVATDGLYFGQGLLNVMDKDELAGPIISASTQLLKLVTKQADS